MIRTKKRMGLCLSLLVLNLLLIWGNSLLPGSVSGAISHWVKDLLGRLLFFLPALPEQEGHGLLRKLAHFTEFCLLGMVLTWLFAMLQKGVLPAFLGGFAAACVDETIQRFVPDRGPSLWDVGIDTAGVTMGILLLCAGFAIYQYTQRRKRK